MLRNSLRLPVLLKILPLFLVILLFSCRKKDSDCYECTTTFKIYTRIGAESEIITISDTREKCDQTEDQIREYENMNTDSTTYINGDVRIDTVVTTLCTR